MSIPSPADQEPMCDGSFLRVPNESALSDAVGWGECPICRNGFYTEVSGTGHLTLPRHPKEKDK